MKVIYFFLGETEKVNRGKNEIMSQVKAQWQWVLRSKVRDEMWERQEKLVGNEK